uniref:BPTI/Kunitz inhibitor domain-containing protein n=1 Tax=Elaeophora elaphi TaxID=1147741 RepID=A0A0R3RJG4_9BILA
MLKSTVVLILIKCISGQEMLENIRCNQYPDRGTCEDREFTVKWYYDRYAHRCRKFYYGGCEGNENRFDSFEVCSEEEFWKIVEHCLVQLRCHCLHDTSLQSAIKSADTNL